jgi:3-hydroxyisobutyrate dehydrogenase
MAIGFIGLGNIGRPMAQQLLKLGEEIWVYDVAAAAAAELAARGARVARGPRELATHCRIVGICVRDEPEVGSVLHGNDGLLAHLPADAIVAVHSTVAHAAVLGWAAQAAARHIHLIDAPMSGGAAGAEQGTLVYMAGGAAELIERCRPLWATSGEKIIRLARAGGLNAELLTEVGRANGVVTQQMAAFMSNRDKLAALGEPALRRAFAPFAALADKDLHAALASARELAVSLPATEQVTRMIETVFLNADG